MEPAGGASADRKKENHMKDFSPATRKLFDDGLSQLLDRIDAATGDVERRKKLYRAAAERFIEVAGTRLPENRHMADLIDRLRADGPDHPDPRAVYSS
jgi:hypothetical protein